MHRPFVIFALPRSRTKWLSRYLSYGGWHCGHDELRHMRSLDDVRAWLSQPFTGTVETAGAWHWRLLEKYCPEARVAVIRRPVDEVMGSLARCGLADTPALRASMEGLGRKLDQIAARWPGALSVDFCDLEREQSCARLFEHSLPHAHDPAWWAAWAPVNVQIDMAALVRYVTAYKPALDRLAAQARQQMMAALAARPAVEPEGVTIQCEPFDSFYRDGQALFREHEVLVGEHPESFAGKNIALMRQLDELGALQIVTARCNGRMFGYLMTVISPSLESPDRISAINTTFFASSDLPGLGLKLQRAALAYLKARGVTEVAWHAGVRGDGPRMAPLYRRLGAEDFGQVFRLTMED